MINLLPSCYNPENLDDEFPMCLGEEHVVDFAINECISCGFLSYESWKSWNDRVQNYVIENRG